jgi:peptidyl-prolyl cis-trans isomerase D
MSKAPHPHDDDTPRKKKRGAGVLVWVLMAMLIAGLGGFGVENFGGGASAIGKVGNTEIAANDYAREVQNQVRAISQQFGTQLSMTDARALGVDRQALSKLVNNAALDNEAASVGLSVGDAAVAAELGKIAAFRGLDGSFDRAAYGETLKQNNTNEAAFEAGIRAELARTLLTGAVAGGVQAPQALSDTLFTWAGEKRGLTLLVLDETALDAPLPAPTEAEVKAHYDANIAAYTRPEAKRIQYAALLPETLAATMEVPEDEVKAAYEARRAEFVIPEKRLVERLVFPDEAAAAEARARFDQGTAFEDLVKERGLTLEDIDMGDVTRADLAEAGEAVFALEGPGVVGPLPSSLGPALYRMNAVLAAQETTYDQARPELLKALQLKAATKAIGDKIEGIDDLLAGGASLEELSKEFGMELGTTDYAPGASDNDPITLDPAFAKSAAALNEGDFAEAITLANGGIVALQMLETVPPAPVPLEKITERVTAETRAEALAKALAAKATTVKAAVDGGATLESQGAVTPVEPQDRQATLDAAPPSVLAAAFEMNPGEVRLIEDGGFVGLVRLDSIAPADATSEDGTALRDAIQGNVKADIGNDLATLFTAATLQSAGITLDQPMIDAVNAQMGN